LEFIRNLFNREKKTQDTGQAFRGAAPVQTQKEQDATRERMETEMAAERERREAKKPGG
jgi:hypothetical protein